MWVPIIILIAVIFLLRNIASSHKAAASPLKTKSAASSCGSTGGDTFTSGRTIVAGVPEPQTHCCHIAANPIMTRGIPIHVVFPIPPPPPIAIQTGSGGGGLPKPPLPRRWTV